MKDPRGEIIADLEISSCRIVHTDTPVVLLCGGIVKIKEHPDFPDPSIESLRHLVVQAETNFELFRPEEITKWQEDAVFKNLVDFETELAAICSLVVIILESPGAIAELGAFSQLNELRDKLVVIKSSSFTKADSFINLGILSYLKETNVESVKTFPWDVNKPEEIGNEMVIDIVDEIAARLKKISKTRSLKTTQESHATTLICDLIRIFVALKQAEIYQYSLNLGFKVSLEEVKRKLFLLEKFQLIKLVEYAGATYYCRTKEPYNRLRLSSASKKRLEDTDITLDCLAYYKESRDRHRLGAIRAFREKERE